MSKRATRTLSNGPPEGQPWAWMTSTMLGSITFRALGIHARRILDFLIAEHMAHGGKENGNLAAPYKQLQTWGVTADDVRRGLAELYATGFVVLVHQGMRQEGGGNPSRYALTWLPTMHGSASQAAPTHDWLTVLKGLSGQGVGSVAKAKAWLRGQTSDHARGSMRGRAEQDPTPHLRVVSPLTCGARAVR